MLPPYCDPASLFGVALARLDLSGVFGNDFRRSSILRDLSRNTDVLSTVFTFRIAKLGTIRTPNDDREYLIRVCLVKVDKRGPAPTGSGIMGAGNFATNSCRFADVVVGLRCCDHLRCEHRQCHPHSQDANECAEGRSSYGHDSLHMAGLRILRKRV